MKSMTGYGRGEAVAPGIKFTTEISSVNRKQAELVIHLPRELDALEPRVRTELNKRVARGRVTAKISIETGDAPLEGLRLNAPLLRACAQEMRELAKELRLAGEITMDTLLRVPGVFQSVETSLDCEALWPAVENALGTAITNLVSMREAEGRALAQDLEARVSTLRKSVAFIAQAAPAMASKYLEQLRQKVAQAGLALPAETDERLLKELVLFADRSDISEEITRLNSHFAQFDECLASSEPVGRTLDFLAQEMNREINTIGSKSAEAAISREVVNMKTELEKFREQLQNIE
jgi:uncharacterized protein (TIGR00255 family)